MRNDDKKDREPLHLEAREWNVGDRIKTVIGKRSIRQAARDWGLPFATVNNWLRGAMPALDAIAEISKKEGVSLEWIAYGEESKTELAQPSGEPSTKLISDLEHLTKVPTFDIEAAAGAGAWISDENISDYWYVPRTLLRQERLEHAELCIINATGDSMAPGISSGDRLLVKTNIDRDVALSGVYVINLDGYLRVKRLEFTLYPAGYRITSDNELYPEEFISADELDERLSIIGEVVRVLVTSVPQPEKRRGPVRGKTHSPSLELIA